MPASLPHHTRAWGTTRPIRFLLLASSVVVCSGLGTYLAGLATV
nr:MAG TPA: hypothetical protein [Caudoviricetes sp.]